MRRGDVPVGKFGAEFQLVHNIALFEVARAYRKGFERALPIDPTDAEGARGSEAMSVARSRALHATANEYAHERLDAKDPS